MRDVLRLSAGFNGGRIVGSSRVSVVLPVPGEPILSKLCTILHCTVTSHGIVSGRPRRGGRCGLCLAASTHRPLSWSDRHRHFVFSSWTSSPLPTRTGRQTDVCSGRAKCPRPSVARNGLGVRPVEEILGGVRHPHHLPHVAETGGG